jgi:hypothetical protein
MSLMISMSNDFKIGETRDCRINFAPAKITWRDKDTLVIEPDDARRIVSLSRHGGLISFACTSADGSEPHVTTPASLAPEDQQH